MNRMIRDFLRAELRGLLPLLGCIAALLGFLLWKGLPAKYAALYLLLPPVLALRAWHSIAAFRRQFERLPLAAQERLAREYAAPHPCFPLYQGEARLLSDCLLCRSRRALLLLPAETLAVARLQHYSGRNRMVCGLILTRADGSSCRLEAVGKERASLERLADALRAWGVPFEGDANA